VQSLTGPVLERVTESLEKQGTTPLFFKGKDYFNYSCEPWRRDSLIRHLNLLMIEE
jgi:glycogen debranching enzyme